MLSNDAKNQALKHLVGELTRRASDVQSNDKTKGPIRIQLDVTKADVPTLFGLTRAEATYALNHLKRDGLIVMEGSTISIPDLERLTVLTA